MIISILVIGSIVFVVQYIIIYFIYGKIIDDSEILEYIERNKSNFSINIYSESIIHVGNLHVVKMVFIPLFSKYHIQNANVRISRFSKSHKLLNEMFNSKKSKLKSLIEKS